MPERSLQGSLDHADRDLLRGWARDPDLPDGRISLLVTANDELIGRILADRPRADLAAAGLGDGRHSFELRLLPPLSPLVQQVLSVRRESDGVHIPGSPVVLPAVSGFGENEQMLLARLLAAVKPGPELRTRLSFLAAQTEALLQLQADADNPAATREALRRHRFRWGGIEPEVETRAATPRALVIDERLPQPGRDAGSEAVMSHMLSLRRLGFEVCLVAADMKQESVAAFEAVGIDVLQPPWCASVEEVLRREPSGFDLVYLHRVSVGIRYAALARHYQPNATIAFSVADLHHLRLARQAESEQRPDLGAASAHVRAQELAVVAQVDVVITHSSAEAALLRRLVPGAKVQRIPWAIVPRPTKVAYEQRHGVAFIGSFEHAPNVDAALWLALEIMPLVRAQDPSIACVLVGATAPDRLTGPFPGVTMLGHVPDLTTVFDQVRLTVAPLAYGAGAKGKVLASLAAGVPCVGTGIAFEGLDLPTMLTAQTADDSAGLAELILRLHRDEVLAGACRSAGLAHIVRECSEAAVDALMAEFSPARSGSG